MNFVDAVNAYQKTKKGLGRVPYRKEISKNAAAAISKKYPNWFDFLETQGDAATTPSNKKMSRYITNNQLIDEIKRIYQELGYPPHRKDYRRTMTAINHFGSWTNFLNAAGIKATYVGYSQYTKEEVIFKVKKYIEKYHEFPVTDNIPLTGVSLDTILRMFGSLENLAKELNEQTRRVSNPLRKERKLLYGAEKLQKEHKPINRKSVSVASGLTPVQVGGVISHYKTQHKLKTLSFVEYMQLHGFKAMKKSSSSKQA